MLKKLHFICLKNTVKTLGRMIRIKKRKGMQNKSQPALSTNGIQPNNDEKKKNMLAVFCYILGIAFYSLGIVNKVCEFYPVCKLIISVVIILLKLLGVLIHVLSILPNVY